MIRALPRGARGNFKSPPMAGGGYELVDINSRRHAPATPPRHAPHAATPQAAPRLADQRAPRLADQRPAFSRNASHHSS